MYVRPLLLFCVALLLGSCVPVYYAANSVPPRDIKRVSVPPGATVRVVHGDPGNSVQLFVERAMSDAGFTVYSNGLVSASVPVADLRYETSDTTVYRTDRGTVFHRLYEDPQVDYLLKYSYTGEDGSLHSFSASLVAADTGELLASYTDTYMLARSADRVMEDFTESLTRAIYD